MKSNNITGMFYTCDILAVMAVNKGYSGDIKSYIGHINCANH